MTYLLKIFNVYFVGDYFRGILRISFSSTSKLQSIEESVIGDFGSRTLVLQTGLSALSGNWDLPAADHLGKMNWFCFFCV
jgi:hypothetical protein